jgi:DNA-binding transcriptional LysR family regulator
MPDEAHLLRPRDPVLNRTGENQATQIADRLAREGVGRIVSSPQTPHRIPRLRLPKEGSRFSHRIMAAFARADIWPKIVARMSRASAILTLVASETGTGFIPLSLAGLVPNGVAVRPFAKPALTVPFSLVWRNDPGNCGVDRFVAIARETTGGNVGRPSQRPVAGEPG